MIVDIEQRYAEIEKYIAGNGGAAVDPVRARAHAIVVAFVAPNPSAGPWHLVMDMHPLDTDAWNRFGVTLGPVAKRVQESLENLGHEVYVETDQPARMAARKKATR